MTDTIIKGKYLKSLLQCISQIAFDQKHKWKLMIQGLHVGKLFFQTLSNSLDKI